MRKPHAAFAALMSFALVVGLACDLVRVASVAFGQPEPTKETLFQGITYEREVRTSPRPMVIHIVTIDLKASGIKALVTPPADADSARPLAAQTTSEFLRDHELQLAINGDGFSPWYDLGPLGYSPEKGGLVSPIGFAASRGTIYSEHTEAEPTLYIFQNNKASINHQLGKVYNAISGTKLLVWNGDPLDDLGDTPHPRTAVGLNRPGNTLIIIVVDGRQPGYSEGATLTEMAELLLDHGAYTGMNLDGGGSTTLVVADENGNPRVLNSPIHQGIPGNERPVGNHLGFWAKEK